MGCLVQWGIEVVRAEGATHQFAYRRAFPGSIREAGRGRMGVGRGMNVVQTASECYETQRLR